MKFTSVTFKIKMKHYRYKKCFILINQERMGLKMSNKKYEITDAELEIMKLLWSNKELTLNEIVEKLSENEKKNKSTIKTLLYRLIEKQSVKSITNKKKENTFIANISKNKYLKKENESFLSKLYNGSTNNLLLNFVEEKKISKKDLQDLLDLIESED